MYANYIAAATEKFCEIVLGTSICLEKLSPVLAYFGDSELVKSEKFLGNIKSALRNFQFESNVLSTAKNCQ